MGLIALSCLVKGVYCLVIGLSGEREIEVGSLGTVQFSPGVYVYVGSAINGLEHRIRRHKSTDKKRRWHIDYLLSSAEVIATVALATESRDFECRLASAVSECEYATRPVKGFGSSDCRCPSHLFYFGDAEPETVIEELNDRLSRLECVYPRTNHGASRAKPSLSGRRSGSVRQ